MFRTVPQEANEKAITPFYSFLAVVDVRDVVPEQVNMYM